MAVGAANRAVAVFFDEFDTALVLAFARPAIEHFDREYVLERRFFRVMLAEADVRASGMTRDRNAAHPRDFVDHFLRGQMDVREIEAHSDDAERASGRVRLWVEDNGIGIAAEHRERIFRAFERLHGLQQYPGTGIGLAIVQKGALRLGGQAGVESAPGTGSRFWVDLREAEAPAA